MRRLLLAIALGAFMVNVSSQTILVASLNLPRCGDRTEWQEISCRGTGSAGADACWDLSASRVLDNSREREYFVLDDSCTLFSVDDTTQKTCTLRNDTLLTACVESNQWKTAFKEPIVEYAFPTCFGDSLSGPCQMQIMYCDGSRKTLPGTYSVVADAWGTLILPDCDTLHNVLRVCTSLRTSRSEKRFYRWYAAGYRYPVLESHCCEIEGENAVLQSWFYPPSAQEQLDDELNERVRGSLPVFRGGETPVDSSVRLYLTRERNLEIVRTGAVSEDRCVYGQGGIAVRRSKEKANSKER